MALSDGAILLPPVVSPLFRVHQAGVALSASRVFMTQEQDLLSQYDECQGQEASIVRAPRPLSSSEWNIHPQGHFVKDEAFTNN